MNIALLVMVVLAIMLALFVALVLLGPAYEEGKDDGLDGNDIRIDAFKHPRAFFYLLGYVNGRRKLLKARARKQKAAT